MAIPHSSTTVLSIDCANSSHVLGNLMEFNYFALLGSAKPDLAGLAIYNGNGPTCCMLRDYDEIDAGLSPCMQKRITAEDMAIFQPGTRPALTAFLIACQLVNTAEPALVEMRQI